MTTIGIIGAGMIGSTLARLALAAGHEVVLSNSRGPGSLKAITSALGDVARAGTVVDAAEAGEIVIVTIPLKNYRDVPAEPLVGKVVIDTNNYYPDRDGNISELDDESTTTSELLQAHLPASAVVKGFNNIYSQHLNWLTRPFGAPDRSTLPIAGNDATAKEAAAAFINSIGFDVLDAGPLAEGWRFQRDLPAYCLPYIGDTGEIPGPGVTVDRHHLAAKLAEAKRYRDM